MHTTKSSPTPRNVRFTHQELTCIGALAEKWGPVVPLSLPTVVRIAVRRVFEAEFGAGEGGSQQTVK